MSAVLGLPVSLSDCHADAKKVLEGMLAAPPSGSGSDTNVSLERERERERER